MSDDLGTRALSVRREPAEWGWFDMATAWDVTWLEAYREGMSDG